MLPKKSTYKNLAEPFHCDFSERLFIGHLGNHMLNAADFHSTERGYGMAYLNSVNRTWVLSRLVIEMKEYPCQYDSFLIDTWVEGCMKFFTHRNFTVRSMEDASGGSSVLGYGRSIWAMIDTQSRQPVDIFTVHDGIIADYVDKESPCPIAPFRRVKFSDKACLSREILTGYSDVDINGHINSVKYIEHIMNAFPIDFHRAHRLYRIDLAYVAESHGGDVLRFYTEQLSEHEYGVSVRKLNKPIDGDTCGASETEVVYARLDFHKQDSNS